MNMNALVHRLGNMVDAFRPADGSPPRSLYRFFAWCLSGAWAPLGGAAAFSAIAGALEVVTALVLGVIIDAALQAGPERFFSERLGLILACIAFFVIARPVSS